MTDDRKPQQKRPEPPKRRNAQGEHEGSAHAPEEFLKGGGKPEAKRPARPPLRKD